MVAVPPFFAMSTGVVMVTAWPDTDTLLATVPLMVTKEGEIDAGTPVSEPKVIVIVPTPAFKSVVPFPVVQIKVY